MIENTFSISVLLIVEWTLLLAGEHWSIDLLDSNNHIQQFIITITMRVIDSHNCRTIIFSRTYQLLIVKDNRRKKNTERWTA